MSTPCSIAFTTFQFAGYQLLLACDQTYVHWISIGADTEQLQAEFMAKYNGRAVRDAAPAMNLADRFIRSADADFNDFPATDPAIGTEFQRRVWSAIRAIPRGRTASYAELAQMTGQPTATRAVATACGANQLALLIPCHRVIRGDGSLGKYRWGDAIKRALLGLEGVQSIYPVEQRRDLGN
jgi:AraC family transcriptional regulator of adaptative response/methylated-DNA-[protein]-cysteine methyltransferase